MLTLLVTVLATAYFVVPELLSRFVFGFFFVRKAVVVPKSEELMRAAFWAVFPLALAWLGRNVLLFKMPSHSRDNAKIVFSSLYSEKLFTDNPQAFFHALTNFARANVCLLSRAYVLVILGSWLMGWIAKNFGRVRAWLSKHSEQVPHCVSPVLHRLILPRISEWHLALSTMLLADAREYSIEVDVMTGTGMLYRGSVQEKTIASDGALQTLILNLPERFLRAEFVKDRTAYEDRKDKQSQAKPESSAYWRKIPGELFLLVGSDIKSVNVRHVNTLAAVKPADDPELKRILQELSARSEMLSRLADSERPDHPS